MHWFGIVFAVVILLIDFIFFLNRDDLNLFFFLIGISFVVVALPFVAGLVLENKKDKEMGEMFL